MSDKIEIGKKRTRKAKCEPKFHKKYSYELRLKAVKLHLEGGIGQQVVCRELGVSKASLGNWVRAYRSQGEEGLRSKNSGRSKGKKNLPEPVTAKILEIKKQEPSWGVKKIAQVMKRMFWLPGSPETVRQRLHEAGVMNKERAKRRRNLTRPRFFERATPNQMWQTDIFTFRLGGKYAYLIAFMDDYSRYVVGADLFRSPTGAAVIEVYRVAMGEYQPPKEMLTDNGRQYTAWRGKSRFEAELQKDRVIHIKSRPQHPMTLGKVERFWSSIWQEFLARAPFDSFEAARERIRLWIRYYNHKRPHQGIGGVCPADRYFEVASELRKTISAGVADNVLEMALRGMPRAPFYMVGRMEGQSVVLRAEKGKLKLSVAGEDKTEQELVYDLQKGKNDGENSGKEQQSSGANEQKEIPGQSPGLNVSAEQKVQAVLAVWTERVKPVDVCRQMGVNWITFKQWQDRAMEGMLQALEGRVNLAGGAVLSPRLQALISKRRMASGSSKLESRLAKLAQNPVASAKQEEVMA